MDVNYFDLSGGINQASTKTELGLNPKKIYWTDSENIEIYNNKGIKKQKGHTLFLEQSLLLTCCVHQVSQVVLYPPPMASQAHWF